MVGDALSVVARDACVVKRGIGMVIVEAALGVGLFSIGVGVAQPRDEAG